MIKAIIFDFFGVICSDEYWQAIKNDRDLDLKFSPLSEQVNLGKIQWSDFVKQISEATGRSEAETVNLYEKERIDPRLVSLIANLRKKYKTALLTNASSDQIRARLRSAGLDKIFTEIVISSERGLTKPDPRIFRYTLAKLAVEPEEAIFIDDISRYIYAAKELGIKTILYNDFGQMKTELVRLLAAGPDN